MTHKCLNNATFMNGLVSLLSLPGSPVNIMWIVQCGFPLTSQAQKDPLERRIPLYSVEHTRGFTTFVTLFFAESSCFGHGLSSSI